MLQQMYFYCILAKSLALGKPLLKQFWAEPCTQSTQYILFISNSIIGFGHLAVRKMKVECGNVNTVYIIQAAAVLRRFLVALVFEG